MTSCRELPVLLVLVAGIVVVVFAADVFVDGLLGVAPDAGDLRVRALGRALRVRDREPRRRDRGEREGPARGRGRHVPRGRDVPGLWRGGTRRPDRADPRRAPDAVRGLDRRRAGAAAGLRGRRTHLPRRGRAPRGLVGGRTGRAGPLGTRAARLRGRGGEDPTARPAARLRAGAAHRWGVADRPGPAHDGAAARGAPDAARQHRARRRRSRPRSWPASRCRHVADGPRSASGASPGRSCTSWR